MFARMHGAISCHWRVGLLVVLAAAALLPTAAWTAGAAAPEAAAVNAVLATDGRTFTVTVPGMGVFRSGFAARVQLDGKAQEISSDAGTVVSPAVHLTEATPYGQAEVTETTIRFATEQVDLMLRLGKVPGVPGVLAQAGIRNAGPQPVNLVSVTPLAMEFAVAGDLSDWLVTSLDRSVVTATNPAPVLVPNEILEPLHVHEYGGLYRRDGTGFLFGPVGTPIAYVDARIARRAGDKVSFDFAADMSGVRVDPGATRWGQQVALLMEPPRVALARWAEWVAKTHGARSGKGALSGWNSWNFLGREVTGQDVLAVVDVVLKNPDRLRPGVIQIDDGYQDITGRKETNDKFPEGLAFYAQRIAATGARPGLYLDFLGKTGAPRLVGPPEWAEISRRIRLAVQSGFTYLKINYLLVGDVAGGQRTTFETYRDDYAAIRQAAGEEAYLLYCDAQPNRATVGWVDASRIGADANRTARAVAGTSQADLRFAIADVLRSYQLHGRWFAVDNDTYYTGTDTQNLSEIAGTWPLVRTWMSMVGLSCGMAITSDPWDKEAFMQYWHNVEVMTPPAQERTEVLDLCTSPDWPRLVGHVRRAWGDATVALLWNPLPAETSIWLGFDRAGMDPKRRYAVWSFWDNRFLGVAKGSWTTPALQPLASQHLCFTDLDRSSERPVLIGSSLHIYCGAAEIRRVASARGALEIELTDAGAREGDLFVYSRRPLILKGATGCAVTGVAGAGENAWRISIADRQRGVPQRVELAVLLPVVQQAWFWLLMASVAASLGFAAWRYAAELRLQRAHALEQERARIARDLHDDLGGGLTEIAMLSEVARQECDQPREVDTHLERIFRSSREMTQALDEIVWAVNPANDSLEKLIAFTSEFAREMLEPAGIRYRLEAPAAVPMVALNSQIRHQLCMALKECLHNIVKHAHAHEVHIRIGLNDRMLAMTIADDGAGFDPAALPGQAGTHDGLANLRQRMANIGGTCELHSAPGQGTRVHLQVRI